MDLLDLPWKRACRSVGTKQCAAICLSHSCLTTLGECPSASRVWTDEAIKRELMRRPNGPLSEDWVAAKMHSNGEGLT